MAVGSKKKDRNDSQRRRVLEGCLNNLPDEVSRIVRVFLSSTFTDYGDERNYIIENAVPKLQLFCRRKGLDFQIADMRWGVRDEAEVEHSTTEIVLKEIEVCQQISRGPTFVAFLGNRYGSRPYPSEIQADEYELLYGVAADLSLDVKLLDGWYKKDRNAVPLVYKLLPITFKLRYYDSTNPRHTEKRTRDREEWTAIDKLLGNIWKESANQAFNQGLISEEIKHKYYQSVTENEIHNGITDDKMRDKRTICFMREMQNINLDDAKAKRFIDVEGGVLDDEANDLLNDLKQNKVPKDLNARNIHYFDVEWTSKGIDPENSNHAQYLMTVRETFRTEMERLIDESLENSSSDDNELFKEVLHHSHFCLDKCKDFTGRQDQRKEIRAKLMSTFENPFKDMIAMKDMKKPEYEKEDLMLDSQKTAIEKQNGSSFGLDISNFEDCDDREMKMRMVEIDPSNICTKPLFIYGDMGSGKTALLSKVIQQADEWINSPNLVKVVRYIGTSRHSTTVPKTLLNICAQLAEVYDIEKPNMVELAQDFSFLGMYFLSLLFKIDVKDRPLLIAFDSMDQLNNSNKNASALSWLPQFLPNNVFMIISLLPTTGNVMNSMQQFVIDNTRIIDLPSFPIKCAAPLMETWMNNHSRTLTSTQKSKVLTAYENVLQPMFLKLSCDRAIKWTSYARESDTGLGDSVKSSMQLLFDDLEKEHGASIIVKSLGYLAVSKSGLTDQEMEDLLSLNDEVLQDNYLYQLPPNPQNIRIPTFIWRRVRYHIADNIVSRTVDNADVFRWYHRETREVAQDRYASPNIQTALHKDLVEYFSGEWHDVIKPLELFKVKKASYPDAKRGVPPQPFLYCSNIYNLRKLNEYPYHLTKAWMIDRLLTEVLANFEWIYTKLKATSISEVLGDYECAIDFMEEAMSGDKRRDYQIYSFAFGEISYLYEMLSLSRDAVNRDVNNLAIQIVGQLGQDFDAMCYGKCYQYVKSLHSQALRWCLETSVPILVPRGPCLPHAGSPLKRTIDIVIAVKGDDYRQEHKVCLTQDGKYLYAIDRANKGDTLKVFDVCNRADLVRSQSVYVDLKAIQLYGKDRFLEFEMYKNRDLSNEQCPRIVIDNRKRCPLNIPMTASGFYVSPSGGYALLIHAEHREESIGKGKKAPEPIIRCHLYDARTMELLFNLKAPSGVRTFNPSFAQFSTDDRFVVTYFHGNIAIYAVQTGNLQRMFTIDGVEDSNAVLKEVNVKKTMLVLPGHKVLCPGADYETDKVIYVRDIISGKLSCQFNLHEYRVSQVNLNKACTAAVSFTSENVCISGNTNKHIYIWDLKTGAMLSHCKNESACLGAVLCGEKEEFLLSINDNSPIVRLWYVGTFSCPYKNALVMRDIVSHTSTITSLNVTPDNAIMITASLDNSIKFWALSDILEESRAKLANQSDLEEIRQEWETVPVAPGKAGEGTIVTTAMAVFKQGSMAVVGTDKGWIILYDLVTMERCQYKRVCEDAISAILVSRDGRFIIVAVRHTVHVMDTFSDTVDHKTYSCDGNITCLAEAKGILVAGSGGKDGQGFVFKLDTGENVCLMSGSHGFENVVITSDATKVVTTLHDYPVIHSVIGNGKETIPMESVDGDKSECLCLRISPDDRFVVSCSSDLNVRVVEIDSNACRYHLAHKWSVKEALFTPDSQQLLTCSFKTILVWSMKNGLLTSSFSRHQNYIHRLCFTQDGRYLVSCSEDKSVVVWDYGKGMSVCSVQTQCPVRDISVADDLSSIVYGPENLNYIGVLQPNAALKNIIDGNNVPVSDSLKQAQAVALSFSTGKVAGKTTRACSIL